MRIAFFLLFICLWLSTFPNFSNNNFRTKIELNPFINSTLNKTKKNTFQTHWTDYPDTLSKKRLIFVSSSAVTIAATSFIMLNELWYKDFPKSKFHTFNDWNEWQGMDKFGHTFSSYYVGVVGYNTLRWSGVKRNKALAFGATWGLVYLTTIEIMDGYNSQWGFSWGDMAANTIGTGLFVGQELLWGEQRIIPKFSFHKTQYAQYRPELLGKTWLEQLFKDYNGQTYWYSANIHSFLDERSRFPRWISVSLGYGATGMIGGNSNPTEDKNGNPYPVFDRYSQLYFSFDIDLHRIKTKSRFLNSVLTAFGVIKFPMPTLEINKNGVEFHALYF